jgi:N6-L-threonylcarbamoyladenine synthase
MARVLGIDTSNYTTSVSVVENGNIVYDRRVLLDVKVGERGLRQSEALFQHVKNLPLLLTDDCVKKIDAVCASIRPRPVEGSYMPVFMAGEGMAQSIANVMGIPAYKTSHQEGHLEAARRSIGFCSKEFIAVHMSGGTTEVLFVKKQRDYEIEIIGGTKDISLGQFIDRIGGAMGLNFPAGKYIDSLSQEREDSSLRIPSRVQGSFFNLSGQETLGLKYIADGYNHKEIAHAVMLCVSKTLEKVIRNTLKEYDMPVLLMGGVASSMFLRNYLNSRNLRGVLFSKDEYASDNAVGAAYIGYEKFMGN